VVKRRDDGRSPRPVVAGVDGSHGSARALGWALAEARTRQVPVRVVTVWAWGGGLTAPGSAGAPRDAASVARLARQTQEALVRAVLARFPGALPELTTELVQGDPATGLIERSRDGDLLVLGSQGVSGAAHLVGSVADTCLRHGACPVVVVPADSTRGSAFDLLVDQRPPSEPRSGLAPAVLGAFGLL
jgi:nucleotide-binding universal stress UspA family protein